MSTKKPEPEPNKELGVDVMSCGRLTLLLFRDPVQFTEDDVKFMRERDVLLVKSPNLANDMRAIDIQTYRSKNVLREVMFDAAIQSIGYDTATFGRNLLALVKK
jgi:hypothetical protein